MLNWRRSGASIFQRFDDWSRLPNRLVRPRMFSSFTSLRTISLLRNDDSKTSLQTVVRLHYDGSLLAKAVSMIRSIKSNSA